MSVSRSPTQSRNYVPGITPLHGTPKRLRTASDEYVSPDRGLSKLEGIISASIEKELKRVGEDIKSSILTSIQSCIQNSIEDGLKGLELDLNNCKKHHEDIANVKKEQQTHEARMTLLQLENTKLKEKIEDLEGYSRRNNIKMLGVPETTPNENCKDLVINLLHSANINVTPIEIVHTHRLPAKVKPRPIIVQVLSPDLKRAMFMKRIVFKEKLNIGLADDLSLKVATARKVLLPILHAAKKSERNVRLLGEKLRLDGKTFTLENLDDLPEHLKPKNVFTPVRENKVAFFTKHSPLSNHHIAPMRIEGIEFNSCEQYLMYSKAVLFNDLPQANLILHSDDPVNQKSLGSKIKKFEKNTWLRKAEEVMETGLVAKFDQNLQLRQFLLKTNGKQLIEANGNDLYWSCGWPLHNPNVWDEASWRGKNVLGNIMMKIRDRLC